MDYDAILSQVVTLLQQEQRIAYRVLNLYSALCTEGSVRSELSNTFTVYQPHSPVCAAASTGTGSPGLALNHVGGTRGATRWTLSSTIDANLTS
jgi:hypothetical protein